MAEVGYASLGIIPSFKGFGAELERGTSKAMIAAGASGGDAFGDAAGKAAGSKFRSRVKSAAKIAAVGLAGLGAAAFKFGGDAVAEARDAAKVGKLTSAVIKSTGGAAKVTERDVSRLSGRLSDMAGVDDELVQSGANVLLTFTKIRNEAGEGNKVFDRATLAALNMSSALGTDLNAASIQVGKALNDPVKGVSALGRAGVQFSEDQKKAIEKMVESGDTLKAQKMILKELDTQFRGSARSQADEADKLSVAWGNFKEEVGTALLPTLDDLAVFLRKKGIPAAKDFFGWVRDDGIPMAKDFAGFAKTAGGHIKDLVGFLNDLPKPAKIAAITALVGGVAALKVRGGRGGLLGSAGSALGLAKPVPVFVTNPGFGVPGAPGGGKPGKGVPGAPPGKAGMLGKLGTAASWLARLPLPALGSDVFGPKSGSDADIKAYALERGFKIIRKGADEAKGSVNDFRTEVFNLKPEVEGLGVKLDRTAGKGRDFNGVLDVIPSKKKTTFETPGLLGALSAANRYGDALDRINALSLVEASPFGFLTGKREHGGPVQAGKAYLVGERRPEVFVPNTGGRIEPDARAFAGRSGGGVTIHIDRVEAHDYADFMNKMYQRRRRAADGVGR